MNLQQTERMGNSVGQIEEWMAGPHHHRNGTRVAATTSRRPLSHALLAPTLQDVQQRPAGAPPTPQKGCCSARMSRTLNAVQANLSKTPGSLSG